MKNNKQKPNHRPSFLDHVVSYISPVRGLRRQMAHIQIERLAAINNDFRGAHTDRTNADWRTRVATADGQILHSTPELVARSRWIVMNTCEGRSIFLSYRRRVVGKNGIRPHANVKEASGKPNTKFNESADKLFRMWANNKRVCDLQKRNTFYGQQRMMVKALVDTGEIFSLHPIIGSGNDAHIAIQNLEYDQLNKTITQDVDTQNEIRYGIEVDSKGTPVAYHFTDRPGNDSSLRHPVSSHRVLEKDIQHIYDAERSGQSHGIPILHALLPKVRDLMEYERWELFKARVQSCLTVLVENSDDSANEGEFLGTEKDDDGKDSDSNAEAVFQPGLIFEGKPGQTIKGVTPTSPHDAYAPYVQQQKQDIASGAGVSYEQMTRDFSRGTYSSQRQTMLEDNDEFQIGQSLLIDKFCNPTWREFITLAVLQNKLNAPGFFADPEPWLAVTWLPPGISWIDPLRQAKSIILTNNANMMTLQEIYGERGLDYKEELQQHALEKEMLDDLELATHDEPQQDVSVLEQNENAAAPVTGANATANGNGRLATRILNEPDIPTSNELEFDHVQ